VEGRATRSLILAVLLLVAGAGCATSPAPEPGVIDQDAIDHARVGAPSVSYQATDPSRRSAIERPAPVQADVVATATPIVDVDDDSEPRATATSLVARAIVPEIAAFHRPGGRHFASFTTPGPYGEPKVFLVREARGRWLRVLLPMRPNGVEGWIRRVDVRLSRDRFAARVDLSERRLTAFRGSNVILRRSVAIGMPQSPTPTGPFYITVLARAPDPTGPYGPLALGLSGFSEVYTEFNGGNGQIAIHGTNTPNLIGQAASAGCVRMRNDDIVRLAKYLPLGTPVRIVR
jgi:lipoprotein-anchoring transpeptidase ErfK/SrfK